MVKTRKGYVWVKRSKRRLKKGSSKKVDTGGYYRKKRKKGKIRIIDKRPIKLYNIRDENGRIIGTTTKRK